MLKGSVALLANSQAKMLGVTAGISVFLEKLSLQVSELATGLGVAGARPEIVSVIVTLIVLALAALAAMSVMTSIAKRIFGMGKGKRLGFRLYQSHLQEVQNLAVDLTVHAPDSDTKNYVKASIVSQIEYAVRTRNKAKRLSRKDDALASAFAHYIDSLKSIVDFFDNPKNQLGEGETLAIEKSAPALHNLLFALGHFDKGRKTRRDSRKLVALTEDVSESALNWRQSGFAEMRKDRPDVVNRIQNVNLDSVETKPQHKITRRDRRKLSPMDEPGKVFNTDRR
jgi:hypothetical protein